MFVYTTNEHEVKKNLNLKVEISVLDQLSELTGLWTCAAGTGQQIYEFYATEPRAVATVTHLLSGLGSSVDSVDRSRF